ncbi:MAG: hypothetical protein DRR16_30160 [Candidatus Parabeggiatoa sp. nov. 3]|nr:MAG: hypothetical protein DRR16_30160 [Gammaproteobacteria bacterium]
MVGKRAVRFWVYIEFIVAKRSHPTNLNAGQAWWASGRLDFGPMLSSLSLSDPTLQILGEKSSYDFILLLTRHPIIYNFPSLNN